MEESLFRHLLSRHAGAALDRHTLAKGADYLRRGRVREVWYHADAVDTGSLLGKVQGSAAQPYTAGIRIHANGSRPRFDTHCTCPLEGECKHVAAIALKELGTRTSGDAAAGSAPSQPSLGPWAAWLDAFETPAGPPAVPPASQAERVFGIILQLDVGALPFLLATPVWLKPGRRGGFTSPQPLQQVYAAGDAWQGLTPEQFEHVAQLRMRTQPFASGGVCKLADARDEPLLETLLTEHPCFMGKPSNGRVGLGPQRGLGWHWHAADDGSQKLVPELADGSARTRLLRIGGLWYWDAERNTMGRCDGDPRLVEAALRAPALQPEQVPLLLARWRDASLAKHLPAPAPQGEIERRKLAPTPVLTLRAFPLRPAGAQAYDAGSARLSFDYDGIRLPLATSTTPERRRQDDRVIEIVRDRASEIAAIERLDELGFIDADLLPGNVRVPRGALAGGDFVLEHGRGLLAAADQVFALTPRLRDAGFRLESAGEFPFELLEEPDDWYAEVDEDSGNAWFDLRLGIDIGGERVDLLPILHRLLTDPQFPLTPRKGEADDAVWLVPLDARRRVPLPLAKLRQLITPLLEWLQGPASATVDGTLRLRHAQATVLEELATQLPWQGAERLRAELERQRAPREPVIEPPGFRATLRAYQRDGLAWLGFLADAGLGGILADDMGLGKTVQVLAHLLAEKQRGRLDQPVLIVAPTSLITNWRDEARRFAPDLRVLVVHGPARAELHAAIPQHDLVITTYPLLPRDADALGAHEYSLLVLDEAQAIKNANSQAAKIVRKLPARRRLAMTGTPLENHLGELWAQFDAVEPGMLGGVRDFTRFYRTPIEKHGDVERRERLKRRIAPLLLRRRKEDVLQDLPEKTEILRSVELDGAQRELYETLRLAQHERVLAEVRKRGLAQSGIVVLDALLKLRQACCDPRLVKLEGARGVEESAKLDLLLGLVDNLVSEDRRVLIFSQFTEMLGLIGDALDARKLRWQSLTGQTPARQRGDLVKRFQEGKLPLFLISLKAGGVGLNLTAADTVIHYDPWWNPAVEAQATDRAHRIGQDKPVFVYKLICSGTVEEKIQALQQRKAELARAVLEGDGSQGLQFDETDLAELFAPM
ncbi:MAG TPA: DEAD/DEAH box helicase [Dokdonella sp.]